VKALRILRIALAGLLLGGALVTPAAADPVAPAAEQSGFALVAGHGIVVNPRFPDIHYQIDVFAVRGADGSVSGFYRHGGPGGVVVEARCVRVESGRALVGGIIVRSPIAGQVGMGAALAVDDRGRFGLPLGDRIISGVGPPSANLCPFSPAQIAGPWDDVVRGDFAVVAGPSSG
jgi:hypothetical protein